LSIVISDAACGEACQPGRKKSQSFNPLSQKILPKNHPDLSHCKRIDWVLLPFQKLDQSDQTIKIMKVQSFIIVDIDGLNQVILHKMQYVDGSGGSDIFGSDWN